MIEKPDILIDFIVRHSWHKISRMYNQKAKERGITMSIGFILLMIEKDGTPSTQLGPKMGMEPTSLSRTLKTMEEKGLIRREEDEVDKRKVLIYLTEEGLQSRYEVRQKVFDFNNTLVSKIPKSKLKVFFEVMEKVDQLVDDEMKKQ